MYHTTQKQKDESIEKTQALLKSIEDGIKNVLNSETFKKFLDCQSKFHTYSFNNTMLIFTQRPDATRVAGFKAWNKFDRHVMKGEKGISILAPYVYKYKKDENVLDAKTGQPVKNPDGTIKTQKVEAQGMTFHRVAVFDIKQTDGKELPEICKELTGNSDNALNIVKAIKGISEIPIVGENITNGSKGYFSPIEKKIAFKVGMSIDQTAKTLVHEYAHSKLHSDLTNNIDRATKETQAESVAYIVSKHFGLDTSDYSFQYLASWASKGLKELKESFDTIQRAADETINKVENYLEHEQELHKYPCPVKVAILTSDNDRLKEGQTLNLYEADKVFREIKTEQSQTALHNHNNSDYNYSKVTVNVIEPPNTYSTVNFDFGDNTYNDITECVKLKLSYDLTNYLFKQLDKAKIQESVIKAYVNEFPAIKHITQETAIIINKINEHNGHTLSINEIKDLYKETGKKLESNLDSKECLNNYNDLTKVTIDLKHAQLIEKNDQIHENMQQSQQSKDNITKTHTLEPEI